MKKQFILMSTVTFVIAACVSAVPVQEDDGISNRLEIGLRAAHVSVDKDRKWDNKKNEGFLGTMCHFYEDKDWRFNNLVVSYGISDWFAISATWDETEEVAETHVADRHTDGVWKDHGPTLTAVFTTPRVGGFFVPYVEAGFHFPDATFDAYPWWHFGYSSYEHYVDYNCRNRPLHGYSRYIDAEEKDPITFAYGVGMKFYITQNLALDLAYRHIDCDLNAHFYLMFGDDVSDAGRYSVPLSYSQLCAGIRWAF